MLERIKFHLDENVSNAVAKGLRRGGIDVSTTSEESLISMSDEQQLKFSFIQNRVIFTQDDDFLKLHQSGVEHSGIVYCHKDSRSTGEIIEALRLIWECLTPSDMYQKIEYI